MKVCARRRRDAAIPRKRDRRSEASRPAAGRPRRCGRLRLAAGALLAAGAIGLAAGCAPRVERPSSVVLVVIDTLRQDHLECYGYHRQTAPTLCRLAAEGALADGLSPTSWTKPATASILTGLHPLRHQAIERNDRLPAAVLTLAEILAAKGYQTLGVSGNGWVTQQFGFDQGFKVLHWETSKVTADGVPTAAEINRRLLPELETLHHPFFLYVHYVDPHQPYDPPVAWDGSALDGRLAERAPVTDRQLDMANFVHRDPQLVRDAIDLYDGEIRFVDTEISELVARLEGLGLLEEALTVVTSDHGEEFEEHGRVGHGLNLYQEVTRVPLIFHAPAAIPAGGRPGRVNLVDIAPTILDLLGITPAAEFRPDGSTLTRLLVEGAAAGTSGRVHLLHLDLDGRPSLALIAGEHKLLLAREPYRKQLFDLASDPAEEVNLLQPGSKPEGLVRIAARLAEEYTRLRRSGIERESIDDAGDAAKALQALGYIAPTRESIRPRQLPRRIRPADSRAGGLLGWERLDTLESCIGTAAEDAADQLLQNWRFIERGGRWTLPDATAILASPDSPTPLLRLEGAGIGRELVRLSVWLDDEPVLRQELPRGLFTVEAPVAPEQLEGSYVLLRIDADPPLTPRPPQVGKPHWTLGVFLRTICLVSE